LHKWNDKVKLIISDVDDTVAPVYKNAFPEVIREIEKILSGGTVIFFLSGQSYTNVYCRVVEHIDPKLRHRVLLGVCNGAEVFGYDMDGNKIDNPVFSVEKSRQMNFDMVKLEKVIDTILHEFNLVPHPVMDIDVFKKITNSDPLNIMMENRKLQFTFDFINGINFSNYSLPANCPDCLADALDIRIPIINRAKQLLNLNGLDVEPYLAGTFAIDFNIKGVNKSLPIENLISPGKSFAIYKSGKIIYSDPNEIEIWGDSFSIIKNGSDVFMSKAAPPECRTISFRYIESDELPGNFNIVVWDGIHQLYDGLLEYLNTRNYKEDYKC
jgi:hydroxymethylpyrimidine pyrophosphatase-like HAD family hydrolase